jgi:hypothetical protein
MIYVLQSGTSRTGSEGFGFGSALPGPVGRPALGSDVLTIPLPPGLARWLVMKR